MRCSQGHPDQGEARGGWGGERRKRRLAGVQQFDLGFGFERQLGIGLYDLKLRARLSCRSNIIFDIKLTGADGVTVKL